MSAMQPYVAVYDVTDDKERNKVVKALEAVGFRVQKSVFECPLDGSLKKRLCRSIDDLDLKTGFVSLYRLHASTLPIDMGNAPKREPESHVFVV